MVKPWLAIQVVYAEPHNILVLDCEVPIGTTVEQAIHLSGLIHKVPNLSVQEGFVGIYGQKVPLNHIINAGDRVECYRSVSADPKRIRQRRLEKKHK